MKSKILALAGLVAVLAGGCKVTFAEQIDKYGLPLYRSHDYIELHEYKPQPENPGAGLSQTYIH
jgi:hypothetical protein